MKRYPEYPILIIDDERHARTSLRLTLKTAGVSNVVEIEDPRETLTIMRSRETGPVLLDLNMPLCPGTEVLRDIAVAFPTTPVIIVTGDNDVTSAVARLKEGAFDYLVKPLDRDRLLATVQKAIEVYELRRENALMKSRLLETDVSSDPAFSAIVTESPKMRSLFKYAEAIAPSAQPTLITGETGSGKELFARALHQLSGRSGKFVAVNAAGLDANVFSDTLFGHVKGAFTGAVTAREGLIENATSGTLFLDEIGDLSLETQIKLLRMLQEREYVPLGSDSPKRTNAKIILATHRDLEAKTRDGSFREDLYYRLRTHHIHIPPLRERLEDIPVLVDHFLGEASRELGKTKPACGPEIIQRMRQYAYPGNLRELKAAVFDAVSANRGDALSFDSFFSHARIAGDPFPPAPTAINAPPDEIQYPATLPTIREAVERLILEAMRRANNNQTLAARSLGVTQQALSHRMKQIRHL